MNDFKSAQGGWMLCEEASDAIAALESEMLRLAVKGRDKIAALEAENERLTWICNEVDCGNIGEAMEVYHKFLYPESEADDG